MGGGGWTGQTHFMVGPGRGPTKKDRKIIRQKVMNRTQKTSRRPPMTYYRTRSVVIVGHFFDSPDGPTSFVDHGPKLRVLKIV